MSFAKHCWWLTLVLGLGLTACGTHPPGEPSSPAPQPGERAEPERAATEDVRDASPVVLGVLVPKSGSEFLVQYGERVLEGIRLAVEQHERGGGRPVELVVLDDGGDAERSAGLVGQLEQMGAVGVVGPLMPAALDAAAVARQDTLLSIISPTAGELPFFANTYSMNTGDTHGATLLAEHALSSGLRRVAMLYPRSAEQRRQANAFRIAFTEGGGQIVMEHPYPTGTTTFTDPILAMVEAAPQAVFVPATERDVLQIAPQLTYYGLTEKGVQVLGGEAWTSSTVLRQVSARYLDGVIATTPLVRASPEVGWRDFLDEYEATYRRTLDSPFPALGHDATRLILAALDFQQLDAAVVSERVAELAGLRGATGVLGIEAGEVVRRPFLVKIERGDLVPIATAATGDSRPPR